MLHFRWQHFHLRSFASSWLTKTCDACTKPALPVLWRSWKWVTIERSTTQANYFFSKSITLIPSWFLSLPLQPREEINPPWFLLHLLVLSHFLLSELVLLLTTFLRGTLSITVWNLMTRWRQEKRLVNRWRVLYFDFPNYLVVGLPIGLKTCSNYLMWRQWSTPIKRRERSRLGSSSAKCPEDG